MSRAWCSPLPGGVRLTVQIVPNAKKTEVVGVLGEALKVKLQAQPIEVSSTTLTVDGVAQMLQPPPS